MSADPNAARTTAGERASWRTFAESERTHLNEGTFSPSIALRLIAHVDALEARKRALVEALMRLIRYHLQPVRRHDHPTDRPCEVCDRWDMAEALLAGQPVARDAELERLREHVEAIKERASDSGFGGASARLFAIIELCDAALARAAED